jgi:hypothetical protein
MLRLIHSFWETATNVCHAKGNYGRPFKAGRGVTQGGPLSAKLFNIIVDAVIREWMRIMRETLDDSDGQLAVRIEALFAIFYVDDGYIASKDAEFLQEALDIIVETFKRVGLATNTKKTQAMVCTPGKIRVQLPSDSYRRLREGVAAGEEGKRAVVCHKCQANLQARSLRSHLESAHDIYQQVVGRAGGAQGADQVPVPRVPRETQQCIYAAPALSGSAPKGFSCDSVGRYLPTMRAVQDAVQPAVPPTHPLAGVSTGGGAAHTEGLGHHVGLGPPAVILRRRGSLGEGGVFSVSQANSRPG